MVFQKTDELISIRCFVKLNKIPLTQFAKYFGYSDYQDKEDLVGLSDHIGELSPDLH